MVGSVFGGTGKMGFGYFGREVVGRYLDEWVQTWIYWLEDCLAWFFSLFDEDCLYFHKTGFRERKTTLPNRAYVLPLLPNQKSCAQVL